MGNFAESGFEKLEKKQFILTGLRDKGINNKRIPSGIRRGNE